MKLWSLWQAAIALCVSVSPVPNHAAEVVRRPNVVFLLADQWRAQALGCETIPMRERHTSIAWRRKACCSPRAYRTAPSARRFERA